MPPCGQAVARHLIVAESGVFLGDDEEHVNGLDANAPLSWAKGKVSMFPEFVVQPDNVADTREACLPPPDERSGGEKWMVPESEQVTEAWMLCAADAACDVNMSMPPTIIDETSHRPARLPGVVVALLRRFSMTHLRQDRHRVPGREGYPFDPPWRGGTWVHRRSRITASGAAMATMRADQANDAGR